MSLKIICLSLIGIVVGKDVLVESMSGSHGGNRVTLCSLPAEGSPPASACSGALLDTRFVFLRASCLGEALLPGLRVLRSKEPLTCQEIYRGIDWNSGRKALRRFVHPQYAQAPQQFDAALLMLDQAYFSLDELVNSTATFTLLEKFEPWIMMILKKYPMNSSPIKYNYHTNPVTSPEQMFMMAVVLPTVSFILFFLFVTSSSKSNSYKTIDEDNEDASVI